MKRLLTLSILCLLGTGFGFTDAAAKDKQVTISYNVQRIRINGSNQIALWIENDSAQLIRTLYASKFTAEGGFRKRPLSLNEWTRKADFENAKPKEVDAISGATQKAGPVTLTWDGKDKNGKAVAKGKYIICMQGNIQDARMMFAKAEITVGGNKQEVKATITFQPGDAAKEFGSVFDSVVVKYE